MRLVNSALCHQLFAGIAGLFAFFIRASLGGFSFTAVYGWTTPILPSLLAADSEIPMTSEQASWMVSMPEVSNLMTPLPAAMLADRIGRKSVILLSAPLFALGWVMILSIRTYKVLLIARFVQGGAVGIVLSVIPVYVGEIASKEYRGAITSLFFTMAWFGYLFEYSTGPFLSFTIYTFLTLLAPIIFFLLFLFQPESPYFYLMKGNREGAKKSLEWLRCSSQESVDEELNRMMISVREDMMKKASWREVIATPTDRKALYILLFVGALRVSCGAVTMVTYATEVFLQSKTVEISARDTTIILGVVLVVGSSISFFIIDYVGRRPLLITSCALASVCLGGVSLFYYFQQKTTVDVSSYALVPPVAILIFCGIAVAGINPINTAYASELFNSKTRSIASSFNVILDTVFAFIWLLTYQYFNDLIGLYFNFMLFSIICISGAIVGFLCAPETKNKSFEQIRKELS